MQPWRPSAKDLGRAPAPHRRTDHVATLALLALIAGAIGIGFAPLFVRMSPLGPSATAFYRFLLAIPLLALLVDVEERRAAARGRPIKAPTRHTRLLLVLAGLFFAGDIAFWHYSIHHTTVANATLLTNFAPIYVTFGAWILFRERPTPVFGLGLVLAVAGAALLVGTSARLEPEHVLGDMLGLASGFFYAGYQLAIKRVRRDRSAIGVIMGSTAVSAAALLVVTVVSEPRLFAATASGWLVLVALALVSQVAGQGLIVYGLAHLPSGFSSVTLLVQPVVAALLAWTLLGEGLAATALLGGAIIVVGVVLARLGSARAAAGPTAGTPAKRTEPAGGRPKA